MGQPPRKPGPFEKGGPSPNPGGRPKSHPEFRAGLKERHPKVLELLDKMLDSDDPDDVRFAVKFVADFSVPKPAPSLAAADGETTSVLAAFVAAIVAKPSDDDDDDDASD